MASPRAQPEGAQTAAAILTELTLPAPAALLDGSGLARGSRISPAALAELLVAAGGRERAKLWPLVTGLPVAAFYGTLADRFGGATPGRGAGFVRAKTGTLTGVSALAGVVEDADGRLLVFAVLADAVPPPALSPRERRWTGLPPPSRPAAAADPRAADAG